MITLALVALVAAALLIATPTFPGRHNPVRDWAEFLVPFCVVPSALSIRSSYGRFVTIIGLATVIGQGLLLIERYVLRWDDPPILAHTFWLVVYALGFYAIMRWPARLDQRPVYRQFIECLVFGTAIFVPIWVLWLGPQGIALGTDIEAFLSALYIVIDLAIIGALTQTALRGSHPEYKLTVRIALAALIGFAASDLLPAIPAIGDSVLGRAVPMFWASGVGLVFLAARQFEIDHARAGVEVRSSAPDPRQMTLVRVLTPAFALPVGFFGLTLAQVLPAFQPHLPVALFAMAMMTLGVAVLQAAAIQDERGMQDALLDAHRELRDKTEEVSGVNSELSRTLLKLTDQNRELAHANEQLARLITVDGMTGLANHRAFHERLIIEADSARRFHQPLCVVVADVDHFRRYNDEFGYPAGDEALRSLAQVLMEEVDLRAYPARYGGEVFAVVVPGYGVSDAVELAQRVAKLVRQRQPENRLFTLSFGIAGIQGNQWPPDVLVSEAFRALRAAKERGRNRIVLADDLDRRCLSFVDEENRLCVFDPTEPLGLAVIFSAGLRGHPQALTIEPDIQLVAGLLTTLELKDVETRDHSERVMWYAMRLAQSLMDLQTVRMSQQELRVLGYGALLHDIGKVGVPEAILKFPGKLTDEMRAVINEHPRQGAQLIEKFPALELALPVVRHHHERWDGKGYPSRLAGSEIPLAARIFALVDALEALTSHRPYKEPVPIQTVTEILKKDSGTHFDPAIVEAYLAVPESEWLELRARERFVASNTDARNAAPTIPL